MYGARLSEKIAFGRGYLWFFIAIPTCQYAGVASNTSNWFIQKNTIMQRDVIDTEDAGTIVHVCGPKVPVANSTFRVQVRE